MRHLFAACLVLTLAGCTREEPLPLAPPAETSADQRARWLSKPQVAASVFDHFTQADLLSAANSRYGAVELNLTSKPELAWDAAQEAKTYLELASQQAESIGQKAEADYQRRAAALIVDAAEAARAGDSTRALETFGAARRALDAAIELGNSSLVGVPRKSA
jgi:predicted small lipoprotein YifL